MSKRPDKGFEKICLKCNKKFNGYFLQKYCDGCNPKRIKKGCHNSDKTCVKCGKEFKGHRLQKFCSDECRIIAQGRMSSWKGLSTGTVGAIQELRVSVDLMSKGFEVFRALSPHSSCDLLALKDGKQYTFEVRTAYRNYDGKAFSTNRDNVRAKYLVSVLPDEIFYEPKIL